MNPRREPASRHIETNVVIAARIGAPAVGYRPRRPSIAGVPRPLALPLAAPRRATRPRPPPIGQCSSLSAGAAGVVSASAWRSTNSVSYSPEAKSAMLREAAQQIEIGGDANQFEFVEGALERLQRCGAIRAADDELGDQRIVILRDAVAAPHAGIDAHRRALARRAEMYESRRPKEGNRGRGFPRIPGPPWRSRA